MKSFDQEAGVYDAHFSHSCVGIEQRRQVWQQLEKQGLTTGQRVLELNCGTGIDAAEFLRRGNHLLATDASEGMLREAQKRIPAEKIRALPLEALASLEGHYSLLFSNFGGVNCLDRVQMRAFLEAAAEKLEDRGQLVLVVMGKRCLWDRLYLRFKGRRSEINRRNTDLGVEVPVADGSVTTWYYCPKELVEIGHDAFAPSAQKPIGLYVPPSYLAPFFERRKLLFRFLKFLDRLFRFPGCANFSDHYYLSLRKK